MMNCNVMSLPFTYLGLPLGGNPKKYHTWEGVTQKIRKRSPK